MIGFFLFDFEWGFRNLEVLLGLVVLVIVDEDWLLCSGCVILLRNVVMKFLFCGVLFVLFWGFEFVF